MREPRQLQGWIRVIIRDLVIPGAGLWLVLIEPGISHLAAWQLPLVAGMIGTPLVAPRGDPPPPPPPTPGEEGEASG